LKAGKKPQQYKHSTEEFIKLRKHNKNIHTLYTSVRVDKNSTAEGELEGRGRRRLETGMRYAEGMAQCTRRH